MFCSWPSLMFELTCWGWGRMGNDRRWEMRRCTACSRWYWGCQVFLSHNLKPVATWLAVTPGNNKVHSHLYEKCFIKKAFFHLIRNTSCPYWFVIIIVLVLKSSKELYQLTLFFFWLRQRIGIQNIIPIWYLASTDFFVFLHKVTGSFLYSWSVSTERLKYICLSDKAFWGNYSVHVQSKNT